MNGRGWVSSESGLLDMNASQTRRAEMSEANSYHIGAASCGGSYGQPPTGISIYHLVTTPVCCSVKWVATCACNGRNEAADIAMCQCGFVPAIFEESSERVDDSTDFGKDV